MDRHCELVRMYRETHDERYIDIIYTELKNSKKTIIKNTDNRLDPEGLFDVAFYKTINKLDVDGPYAFSTLFYTILKNDILFEYKYMNRHKRKLSTCVDNFLIDENGDETSCINLASYEDENITNCTLIDIVNEVSKHTNEYINLKKDKDKNRIVLNLFINKNMKVIDIANLLDLQPNAVHKIIFRYREYMKEKCNI